MYCQIYGQNVVEDELHFLFKCPLYNDIRLVYIPGYLSTGNDACTKMVRLLNSKSSRTLSNISRYIYFGFKKRNAFIAQL